MKKKAENEEFDITREKKSTTIVVPARMPKVLLVGKPTTLPSCFFLRLRKLV
jgi:hypothetical protein